MCGTVERTGLLVASVRIRSALVALVAVVVAAAPAAGCGQVASGSPAPGPSVPTVSSEHKVATQNPAHGEARSPITAPPLIVPFTVAPPTTVPVTTTAPTTTDPATSTQPPSEGSHGPLTSPPLPPPGAGFDEGQVTAVGDSVMIDYETLLEQDIPGINVQAVVGEQWATGEAELQQLKSEGQLGSVVIVGLSTNGPISSTDFASMMRILSGASRVVFVSIHVDRPWQDPNNAVLAAGVHQYPNAVLADWYDLAEQNPGWLYSDDTHLPIDGPGAQALANLVAEQA